MLTAETQGKHLLLFLYFDFSVVGSGFFSFSFFLCSCGLLFLSLLSLFRLLRTVLKITLLISFTSTLAFCSSVILFVCFCFVLLFSCCSYHLIYIYIHYLTLLFYSFLSFFSLCLLV